MSKLLCNMIQLLWWQMQQVAKAAAIIQSEYGSLFAIFSQNYAGSNVVDGIFHGAHTWTCIATEDGRWLCGLKLLPYPLLLKKRLSILY